MRTSRGTGSSVTGLRRTALAGLGAMLGLAATSCGSNSSSAAPTTANNDVFFVGYVYNGATGAGLAAADLTAISIKYRDTVITTKIADDGRFVSQQPLPTWQDYAVYIGAVGYRPLASRTAGIDL